MTKYIAMTDHDACVCAKPNNAVKSHKAHASWRWADLLSSGDYFESLKLGRTVAETCAAS
jgi:hypothetical protein